ncbi:unnamed protein product [Urochloa humidicola]
MRRSRRRGHRGSARPRQGGASSGASAAVLARAKVGPDCSRSDDAWPAAPVRVPTAHRPATRVSGGGWERGQGRAVGCWATRGSRWLLWRMAGGKDGSGGGRDGSDSTGTDAVGRVRKSPRRAVGFSRHSNEEIGRQHGSLAGPL